jgi:hypothetical protein
MKGFDDFSIIHQHHEFHSNAINQRLHSINIGNVQHNNSGSNQKQIINKTPSYTINTNGTNTNSTAVYMVGQEDAFAFDKFKVHLEHRFDNPVHYAQTLNFSDFPALSGITKCGDYVTSNIARWIDLKSTGNLGTNVGNKVFANFNTIKLNHNNIADDAVEPILNSLSYQTLNLTTLELSHNHLGDGFVNCLLKATSKDNGRAEHSIKNIVLHHNFIGDDGAMMFADALKSGQLSNTKSIDVSGNKITEKGWESFAASVKKIQANAIVIKVAAADTLQGMKEFLTKGFKYYTQTHKVVVTKEFQDELLGVNTSSCEKTKNNILKAAYTAGFIKSLTNGNDYFILAAGAEAGAGALISPDTWDCYNKRDSWRPL